MTVPHVWIRHVTHLLHEACSRTGNPDPSLLLRSRLSQRGLLYQRLGDFNDGSLFRTVRRPGSPRSRCRPRRCPARTRSPVLGRRLPAAPSRGGRSWELSEVSFVRAPPSWPNHPPRPLLLMPPPWGLGFRHRVGWGIAGARCSGAHTAPPSSSPSLPVTALLPHAAFLAWGAQAPELADPVAHSASPASASWLAVSDSGLREGCLAPPQGNEAVPPLSLS